MRPSAPSPLPVTATGPKLGRSVLAYLLAVVAVVTLEPFSFHVPSHLTVKLWDSWFDVAANVALFMPPGFVLAMTRATVVGADGAGSDGGRLVWRAGLLGALASTLVELAQLFEPTRYASPLDVATNACGAALGAWLFTRARRRLGANSPIVGMLALELPLMGLVYVMLPLLSLAALTQRDAAAGHVSLAGLASSPGALGLVALAAFGGTLLGHVQRRHFGPAGVLGPAGASLAAALWFGLGALPALATAPTAFGAGLLVAPAAVWIYGVGPAGVTPLDRRVEGLTLRRAAPWLVAYLVLVPLAEPASPAVAFTKLDVLRRVEGLAAFTVLGYVLAEAWGRLELRYRWTAWRVALVAGAVASATAGLRLAAVPAFALAPWVAAHVLAAAYGGWLYHLQRAHVRALVAASRAPSITMERPTRAAAA